MVDYLGIIDFLGTHGTVNRSYPRGFAATSLER